MNNRHFFILPIVLLFLANFSNAQEYKHMMNNPAYNFYDVCKAADAYFDTHDTGKGSGYKPYLRWKHANESRFYPTGDRSNVNFRIAAQNAIPLLTAASHNKTANSNNNWVDLGPYNANNITHGYNPGIGRVESFYVNPNDPDLIYLGSRSGGFWRTDDGGQTWLNTTDFLVASGVNQIVASPTNPNIVVINVRNGQNGTSHGLYISTDGGLNWMQSNFNPDTLGFGGLGDNFQVFKLAINPLKADTLFIGTTKGLFKADLALTTWTQKMNGTYISDIEFHPTNSEVVYAYDDYYWGNNGNKILISTNGGVNFAPSNSISGNNESKGFIATTGASPDNVYFASDNGVWKSTNQGVDFTLLSAPSESCDGFAVSDLDSANMIYGYLNLQASTNGGTSFTTVTAWANTTPDFSYTHADLRTAECINGTFYVGTDGYLAKTDDNGATWTRLNDGTGIREFYASGVAQGDYRTFMAGSQDNGTSILDYSGWIEWNGGDGMEAIVHPLNPLWMIGSWQYGTRNYTQDGGLTRNGCNNPSSNSDSADWQAPLFFDPNNPMRVYHFGSRIGISEDFGRSWEYGNDHKLGQRPTRAAIAYNNSQIMAGAKNGYLRVTTDNWVSSVLITPGLPNKFITHITFAPNNDSTIAVTYNSYQNDGNKVFISHNLGQTWQNITYNLGNLPIHAVAIDHFDEQYIYIGTELGVYAMPMNGNTWAMLGAGLPNVPVRDLDIHFGSNTLKATTWGRGLWEAKLALREDYPQIYTTSISNPPADFTPKSGYDQFVTAAIGSVNGVSDAYVMWSADTLLFDQKLEMTLLSDSTYITSDPFPYYPKGTKMYFKVFAEDANGNLSETHKFMYTIKPGLELGVNEIANDQLELYPNPNRGKFHVTFNQTVINTPVQVYNMTGQLVYEQVVTGTGVDLFLNLPKGMYTVSLGTMTNPISAKFTIQ